MSTARHEQELKDKANRAQFTATDPIERLRAKCLSRGATGIRGLSR
jgi:calcyphosin